MLVVSLCKPVIHKLKILGRWGELKIINQWEEPQKGRNQIVKFQWEKPKGGTIFDLNLVGGNLRGNYVLINSKRVTNTRINTQIISNVIEKRTHSLCSLFNNTLIIC